MFHFPLPQVSAQQHRMALAENKGCRRNSRRRRPFFRGPVIARVEPRQAASRRERLIFVSLFLFRFRFVSSAHAALAVGLILVKKKTLFRGVKKKKKEERNALRVPRVFADKRDHARCAEDRLRGVADDAARALMASKASEGRRQRVNG